MNNSENCIYSEDEEYIALEEEFNDESSTETDHFNMDASRDQKYSGKRKKNLLDLKAPRGKFSLRWEKDFPWVRADNIDESLGFCTVCDKQLVCKRSHLERHEKSYKHQRCLAGIPTNDRKRNRSRRRTERIDWSDDDLNDMDSIEIDPEYCEEIDIKTADSPKSILDDDKNSMDSVFLNQEERTSKAQLGRQKILNRIDRSRSELNDYYSRLKKDAMESNQPVIVAPARDSFDLFFDSVSASVKTLPPKLAAEVKSRVSQLVAEFELRAICEREAAVATAESMLSYELLPKIQHVTSTTTIDGTGAQIVYTLPIKQPSDDEQEVSKYS